MKIIITILFSMFCLFAVLNTYATDYYINSVTGNDANNGTSTTTPVAYFGEYKYNNFSAW